MPIIGRRCSSHSNRTHVLETAISMKTGPHYGKHKHSVEATAFKIPSDIDEWQPDVARLPRSSS